MHIDVGVAFNTKRKSNDFNRGGMYVKGSYTWTYRPTAIHVTFKSNDDQFMFQMHY